MKLTFIGGTGTVTGSKYLIESENATILVDCGLFQGLKELRLRNREPFPVEPRKIDAVVLTHAHLDHSGYLPLLVKSGFAGRIYCTRATKSLLRILLPDSGRLQEEEAEYANKKGFSKHHPALPLYTEEDAERSLRQLDPIDFGVETSIANGLRLCFGHASHILGAATARITSRNSSLQFSGDLGRDNDPIFLPPDHVSEADYLVIESTYGNRRHDPSDPAAKLAEVINRTIARGGVIVIPAFSVGRTQTLLFCLSQLRKSKLIPDIPIFLNSPMSINATQIFCDHQGEHRLSPAQCQEMCDVVQYVHTREESIALNQRRDPMIIISASGMATGGRILHHLKAFGPNPQSTILLTGYQAAGTRGASLLAGAKTLKIHGNWIPIESEVALIDNFSGHADQEEILDWLGHFKRAPKKTFITHGEPAAAAALCDAIRERLGWNCVVPAYRECAELNP